MGLLDILNSQKDAAALNQVIDHAAGTLTSQIVPALKDAATEVLTAATKDLEAVMTRANADMMADVNTIVGDLRQEMAELRALLGRLDGATVKLALGDQK